MHSRRKFSYSFLEPPLTLLKRKARPVAPVKRVDMSSERFVKIVSQLAQENRRVPPIWSKKIRPIVQVCLIAERKQRLDQFEIPVIKPFPETGAV